MGNNKKQSFVMMNDYINFTDDLTDEQAGVLFKAILAYNNELDLPDMDAEVLTIFKYIKKKMDKNKEAYEKTCEINKKNGSKGGKKKAENIANASESYQVLANANETSEIYHDNDSDNDNDIDIDMIDDIGASNHLSESEFNIDQQLEEFVDAWNNNGFSQVIRITDTRRRLFKDLLNQFSYDDIVKGMYKICDSDYLLGKKGGFLINLDWFLHQRNFVKVLEGNYDNHEPTKKEQKKKNMFNQFEQTDIDFDEYEKQILGL